MKKDLVYLRTYFDEMDESVRNFLAEIDICLDEVEKGYSSSIKDIDNFIFKLKNDDLYSEELATFIDNYIKYYND